MSIAVLGMTLNYPGASRGLLRKLCSLAAVLGMTLNYLGAARGRSRRGARPEYDAKLLHALRILGGHYTLGCGGVPHVAERLGWTVSA